MTREELKKGIEQIVELFDNSVVNGLAEVLLTKEDKVILDMAISELSEEDNTMRWVTDGCIEKCSACGEEKRFPHWTTCPACGRKAVQR